MNNIYTILINAIVSFVMLFIIAKILGKKQIAELSFTDYVIGISLGSITAEWAINYQDPWYYYAIPAAIFTILSLIVVFAGRTFPLFKKMLVGRPITIIADGQIDYKNLSKSKLSINDILGMCRNKGYFDINQIAFAVFETTGDLSILPKSNQKPVVAQDMGLTLPPPSIPQALILDGKIYHEGLNAMGKDEKWLLNELGNPPKEHLKGILLAMYDNGKVIVHDKNSQTFANQLK